MRDYYCCIDCSILCMCQFFFLPSSLILFSPNPLPPFSFLPSFGSQPSDPKFIYFCFICVKFQADLVLKFSPKSNFGSAHQASVSVQLSVGKRCTSLLIIFSMSSFSSQCLLLASVFENHSKNLTRVCLFILFHPRQGTIAFTSQGLARVSFISTISSQFPQYIYLSISSLFMYYLKVFFFICLWLTIFPILFIYSSSFMMVLIFCPNLLITFLCSFVYICYMLCY